MFKQLVLVNVVYMGFKMFCCLELLIGCILKGQLTIEMWECYGNHECWKINEKRRQWMVVFYQDLSSFYIHACCCFITITIDGFWVELGWKKVMFGTY